MLRGPQLFCTWPSRSILMAVRVRGRVSRATANHDEGIVSARSRGCGARDQMRGGLFLCETRSLRAWYITDGEVTGVAILRHYPFVMQTAKKKLGNHDTPQRHTNAKQSVDGACGTWSLGCRVRCVLTISVDLHFCITTQRWCTYCHSHSCARSFLHVHNGMITLMTWHAASMKGTKATPFVVLFWQRQNFWVS